MEHIQYSLYDFAQRLSSAAPIPGGGGSCAYVGALAAALDSMVCSLTENKAKYTGNRRQLDRIAAELTALRAELLAQVDEDPRVFEPLSRAYRIPKDDPRRPEIMENALKEAAKPPMAVLEACAKGIALTDELTQIEGIPAMTDAGCAALFFRAGLCAAALNLKINTKSMADRSYAGALNERCDTLLEQYEKIAGQSCERIMERIK